MSFTHVEVKGTLVNGEKAPTLEQLRNGACTKKQLQAAIVQLIDIVNLNEIQFRKWANEVEAKIKQKQDRPWRASM